MELNNNPLLLPDSTGYRELHITMRPGSTDIIDGWDVTPKESAIIAGIKNVYERHAETAERKQWEDFCRHEDEVRERELADYREKLTMPHKSIVMRPTEKREKKRFEMPLFDVILTAAALTMAVVTWLTM